MQRLMSRHAAHSKRVERKLAAAKAIAFTPETSIAHV
jgi:hypothetical protein